MKPRRPSQFDVRTTMKDRPFERLMLLNRKVAMVTHCVGSLGLTAMIWPRFFAPHRWRFTRYPMPFARLSPEFEGYKILQLTDLHTGKVSLSYLKKVFAATMQTKPDLIVITGDFINYSVEALDQLRSLLPLLHAPDGILGIFGNHDYHEYSWRHIGERSAHRAIHKRLARMLPTLGVTVLRNQQHTVQRGAGKLQIVGTDEMWIGHLDPEKTFAHVDPQHPCLVLQHNPDGCAEMLDRPWQWMLAGHSHGGQIDVPLLGPLYVPMEHREWLRGFYRFPGHNGGEERTLFVSTGLGYSTPIRMRCPPEATLFTLTRKR